MEGAWRRLHFMALVGSQRLVEKAWDIVEIGHWDVDRSPRFDAALSELHGMLPNAPHKPVRYIELTRAGWPWLAECTTVEEHMS